MPTLRGQDRGKEEHDPDDRDDDEARHRPARDLGRREHVADEHERGHEIEQPVGEDRADECRARTVSVLREPPPQDGDPRQLADAAGQRRVPEQADREGRERAVERRVGRVERLHDRQLPGERPDHHRGEVEGQREHDPGPVDEVERVVDEVPVRPAPPDERDRDREQKRNERTLHGPARMSLLTPRVARAPARPRRSATAVRRCRPTNSARLQGAARLLPADAGGGSSSSRLSTASTSAAWSPGGTGTDVSAVITSR